MKSIYSIFTFVIASVTLSQTPALAAVCQSTTADVGEIQVVAETVNMAYSKANEVCFDRRIAKLEYNRGTASVDELESIVESCVNDTKFVCKE